MNWYQTLGLAGLLTLGCKNKETEPASSLPVQTSVTTPSSLPLEQQCTISFAGYSNMCQEETIGGSPVLVKELPDGSFVFFRDDDKDGCYDVRGSGFYMLGLSRRTEENELPSKQYCSR